ncbi:response regulator [uncultured Ramlibacter sp.]|uniref:hybrid sensor histidine kinase/response regulator n=1 Tax=uncultured Ramlibacter sp. TaxID=260755 RepID=UPI00260C6E9B|nr:response regulator [uncultured Ramlibacter sp.]
MHFLVIEDSQLDHEMLMATLALQGVPAHGLRVESALELGEALERQAWDLVICDHHLPGFSGIEAYAMVKALADPPPFIIVSGTIGEETAVEAMRRGVDDYLIKGRLARLGMAVRNAMAASTARREKARAEEQLRESQEQLHELSARLQTLIDEERAAIAREIHDEVGGTLTAMRFDLELLGKQASPALQERLQRALAALAQAAGATQRISRDLHPPILEAGLVAALEWQAGQFQERSGIAMQFRSNVNAVELDRQVAMAVYRTCQEALTNIGKHSGASKVSIDLHYGDDLISMEICDNGRGLAPSDLRKQGSLGLRGLAERARAVNGHIDITSARGRTTLMLWVPLTEQAQPLETEPA